MSDPARYDAEGGLRTLAAHAQQRRERGIAISEMEELATGALSALAAAYRALDARTLTEAEREKVSLARRMHTCPSCDQEAVEESANYHRLQLLAIIDRLTGRTPGGEESRG